MNALTDGVFFAVTLNIPSGITSASNGTYTGKITYTATGTAANNSGITRSATIDFRFTLAIPAPSDTTPPVLTLPDNITAEATGPSGAIVTFTINAYDEVDGFITPTVNPASGSTFPLGATTVNVSATDAAGNTATGSFTVTVVDTTAPEITVPAYITAEATGSDGATVTFSSATDLVDGSVTYSLIK